MGVFIMALKNSFSIKNMKVGGNAAFLKFCVVILTVSMFMSLIPLTGVVYGADSVPATARHIKTAEQLAAIGGVQSEGEYYVLDNDITLVAEWIPIEGFEGTFDGQGHSINNLYVLASSNRQYAGLFGLTYDYKDVTIKNVGVNIGSKGVTAIGSDSEYARVAHAGGLIGYCGAVVVSNCYVTGDVTATGYSFVYAGGLIGECGRVSVANCYVTGDVTANADGLAYAGGLIGHVWGNSVSVEKSYVTGDVTATGSHSADAGGLIGRSGRVFVEKSYVTGDVTANSATLLAYAGGLIGECGRVSVSNCYVTGDVTANSDRHEMGYAGGLIGYSTFDVSVEKSYVTGDVTADAFYVCYRVYAGSLVGDSKDGTVEKNCYRLSTQKITGGTISTDGKSLTPDEMKNQQSFSGWDFKSIWAIKSNVNNGYPHFKNLLSTSHNLTFDGSSSGNSSSDRSSPFSNPLILAGIAIIVIVAVVIVVVFIKKQNEVKRYE